MFIAIKELKKEKLRFGMILSVIVLIAYLVYFLSSLAYGLAQLNRTAIDHWSADGVIIIESANKNLYASQMDFKDINGYRSDNTEFISISTTNVNLIESESTTLVFMGYEDPDSVILPKIIEGRGVVDDFEVVISANIKDKYDVKLGDEIIVSNTKRTFIISGFTENSNFNTIPVVYGKLEMVSDLMMSYNTSSTKHDANSVATPNMPKRASFILVKEANSLETLNLDEDLVFLDSTSLIDALPGYKPQILTFGLMIVALSIIAAIIMGIFMFILTMQKKAIFAVLKIQGYQNTTIISSIIIQILLLVLLGLLIGLGLNQLTIIFLPSTVPVLINWNLILLVSSFIVLSSLVGAIFSAYSVLKIDPLEAL